MKGEPVLFRWPVGRMLRMTPSVVGVLLTRLTYWTEEVVWRRR